MRRQRYVKPGERINVIGNYSEASMHLRVAGKPIQIQLVASGQYAYGTHYMAQIWVDGKEFSFPVTTGEAGFYYDSTRDSYYTYEEVEGQLILSDTTEHFDDSASTRTIRFSRVLTPEEIKDFIHEEGLERYWSHPGFFYRSHPSITTDENGTVIKSQFGQDI
jgi:hypothetical protein